MPLQSLIYCTLAAFFFAGYQLVMRASGLTPMTAGLILHFTGTLVFIPLIFKESATRTGLTLLAAGIAVISGIMQALGQVSWQKLLADRQVEMSTMVVVMIAINIAIMVAGGYFFYGEKLNPSKITGVGLAMVAVWLMVRK